MKNYIFHAERPVSIFTYVKYRKFCISDWKICNKIFVYEI